MQTTMITKRNFLLFEFLGFVFVLFGFTVMLAWWLDMPQLIYFPGDANNVKFNTGFCFALVGVSLFCSLLNYKKTLLLLNVFLLLLSIITLCQYVFNTDLHIDELLYATPKKITESLSYSPRTTINSLIAFIFTALAYIFISDGKIRHTTIVTFLSICLIYLLGLFGLAGNLLKLNLIYSWYHVFQMGTYTAIAFVILAFTLWHLWSKTDRFIDFFENHKLFKACIVNTTVLLLFLLLVGSASFSLLTSEYENEVKKNLAMDMVHRENLILQAIERPNVELNAILNERNMAPSFYDPNQPLHTMTLLAQKLQDQGFSAIRYDDKNGDAVLTAGTFITDPNMQATLHTKSSAQLIWKNGFYLQINKEMNLGSVKTIMVQWPLNKYSEVFKTSLNPDSSATMTLCTPLNAQNAQNAQCFPTGIKLQSLITSSPPIHTTSTKVYPLFDSPGGIINAIDQGGSNVIAAFSPLYNLGLVIVLKLDTNIAYHTLYSHLQRVLWLVFITLTLSILFLTAQFAPLLKRILADKNTLYLQKKEIEESANYTKNIIDNMYDALIIVNKDGIIESANDKVLNVFGYKKNELIGKNSSLLIKMKNKTPEEVFQLFYLLNKTHGGLSSIEITGLKANGSTFPMQASISRIFIKDRPVFICTAQDISDKKMAEEKLRRIIEATPDPIVIMNAKGDITYSNKQSEKMFGYTKEELIGNRIEMLMPEAYHLQHSEHRKAYLKNSHTKQVGAGIELYGKRKNGESFPIEISLSPLETSDGILTLAGLRDISERKKIDTMKNEFISVVSHELRTPLTSILGSLSLLLNGVAGPVSEKAIQLLQIAKQNSERLTRLINDILDVEKIESGKSELHPTPIEISQLFYEVVAANQSYADQHNVKLQILNPLPPVILNVDKDRILQVLTNFIANAINYSLSQATVLIGAAPHNNHLRITVKDQGPGIPAAFQDKIFQKFAQADSSSTRGKSGTGLGLSICKAIIEKMDGVIGFETTPGEGTTFYFDLPPSSFQATTNAVELNKIHKIDNVPNILHIENEIDVSLVIASLIPGKANIVNATSIHEAKEALMKAKYDLVILDLKLPDGSGTDIIPQILQAQIPIIIFSAYPLPKEYEKDVTAYMLKSKATNEVLLRSILDTLKLS